MTKLREKMENKRKVTLRSYTVFSVAARSPWRRSWMKNMLYKFPLELLPEKTRTRKCVLFVFICLLRAMRSLRPHWKALRERKLDSYLGSKWFRESPVGLSEVTLHEFHYWRGKVKLLRLAEHVTFIQLILHHKLSQVTNNLGRRCDLRWSIQITTLPSCEHQYDNKCKFSWVPERLRK